MRYVIFLVGLPGSGKTTWAQDFVRLYPQYVLIDDWCINPECNTDAEHIIITDPMACLSTPEKIKEVLEETLGPIDYLDFISFENDPDAAWANCEKRENKPISKFLLYDMSKKYSPHQFSQPPVSIYRS